MPYRSILFFAALVSIASLRGGEPARTPKQEAAVLVKEGRGLFANGKYVEAWRAFEDSLKKDPDSKDSQILSAVAAYWARNPARALELWNKLYDMLDKTHRGSNEEWELQKNRVMALSALGKWEAVELAVARIYEIRVDGKSSAATAAGGFVREHFWGKGMRAGFWESFDERNESPTLWTITVSRDVDEPAPNSTDGKMVRGDKTVATLAVEAAALPGGGTGYVFSEETDEARRIYKHWTSRPKYNEVRALAFAVLQGKAEALSEKTLKPEKETAPVERAPNFVPFEIKTLGLRPQAEAIVTAAYRLNAVHADVTRLARIAPADDKALDDYMSEFRQKYPEAAATASELAELIAKAKPETVTSASDALLRIPTRSAYLEFAYLTALNTRNRDIPETVLAAFAKSKDSMVRQTAALMLGREGLKSGLDILFKEIAAADARGCELLMGAIDELAGHVIESPPNSQSAKAAEELPAWKQIAAKWHAENAERLEYVPGAKPGEPYWIRK